MHVFQGVANENLIEMKFETFCERIRSFQSVKNRDIEDTA